MNRDNSFSAVPRTYAEWSQSLDILIGADDDETVLQALQSAEGEFESGAIENLTRRLIEVLDVRLARCHDVFTRQSNYCRDISTLGRALLDFRRQLAFLYQVATLPALPDSVKSHLVLMVDKAAQSTQDSLNQSARDDRSGLLSQCVRQHSLLTYREVHATMAKPHDDTDLQRRKRTFL